MKARSMYLKIAILLFTSIGSLFIPRVMAQTSLLKKAGELKMPVTTGLNVHANGNFVYVVDYGKDFYDGAFFVVDVSKPSEPSLRGKVANVAQRNIHDLWYSNNYAYTTHRGTPVSMINVLNRDNPYVVSSGSITYSQGGLKSWQNYLFVGQQSVGQGQGGMKIFDVSKGKLDSVGVYWGQVDGRNLVITSDGKYVYQSSGKDDWDSAKMVIYDVTNKTKPSLVKTFNAGFMAHGMVLAHNDQYLILSISKDETSPSEGLQVWDISNRVNPILIQSLNAPLVSGLTIKPGSSLLFGEDGNDLFMLDLADIQNIYVAESFAGAGGNFSCDNGYLYVGDGGERSSYYLRIYSITLPAVVIDAASNLAENSAILNGRFTKTNLKTIAKYQYGTTASYGNEIIASQTPGVSTNEIIVTASLTGLAANSTYHFRLIASNSAGADTSNDKVFTTRPETTPPNSSDPNYSEVVDADVAIPVSIQITDASGIKNASLYYREGGTQKFHEVEMTPGDNNIFSQSIPGDVVNSRGVEFYIGAMDNFNNRNKTDIHYIQVRIVGEGLQNPGAMINGNQQNAYRLVSFPLAINNPSPNAILVDDLGSYDKTKWRFFELGADQQPHEFPDITDIKPGQGFWLIVKSGGKILDTGAGKTIITNKPYPIALNPGWTFIGNPYNFTIPFSKLSLRSGSALDMRNYEGVWKSVTDSIHSFEGYAVANNTNIVDTLYINPYLYPLTGMVAKALAASTEADFLWSINIKAQCQAARDVDNIAAVAAKASATWDVLDRPEPPVIGEYVSVTFPHPDWGKPLKYYCTDARPEPTTGEIWEFEVKTNIRDKVNLTFEELDNVPLNYEVWLIDEIAQISQELRNNKSYFIAGSGEDQPRPLKLVVGTHGFAGEQLVHLQDVPGAYELSQNFPNPFNPSTMIRFGLPTAEKVMLKIYNLLGEEVVTLINSEPYQAGYHVIVWDGQNKQNQRVANGIYIYNLQAGVFSTTKKMALMK